MADAFFRLALPDASLSIEQNTENVPNDGKFHVLQNGSVIGSFPSLKRARDRFQQLKEETGYQPPIRDDGDNLANREHIERVLDAATGYWDASHKFRGRGGRGGRGGV
jgi:hypothetical protein